MQRSRFGAIDLPTVLTGLLMISFCYAAWLTSIVFCAANGARPLLIAAATFFPIGIVHGVGVWFGGW
jgi:ABC-type arginine transport system permease subunit